MSWPHFGMVVEYVTDIDAAVLFYTSVMGLEIQRQHPVFVQFEHFAIASDGPIGDSGDRELYWLVDDVDTAYRNLADDVDVCLELTEKRFGTLFGIRNPDGSAFETPMARRTISCSWRSHGRASPSHRNHLTRENHPCVEPIACS